VKQPVLQEQGDYRQGIRSAGARGEIAQVKLSGWWLSHPSEKYESVGMMTFPIYGKKQCSKPPVIAWLSQNYLVISGRGQF